MVSGINCNNKWIGNFLTGLTLSLFSLVAIPIIFPISLSDDLQVLILKISCSLTTASKIISILIIKFNSSKIVCLYDQIEEYQIKSFIKHKYYFSTISSEPHSQSSIPSLNALGMTPKFVEYIFQPKTPHFFTKKFFLLEL
jgi:hypothetical protein